MKHVSLNSLVTFQKWDFGFQVTLGTRQTLAAGEYLILLADPWSSVRVFLEALLCAHPLGAGVQAVPAQPRPCAVSQSVGTAENVAGTSCDHCMASGLLICHKSGFFGLKAESVGLLSFCLTSIAGSTWCLPSAPLFSVSVLESCAESTGGAL